MATIVELDVRNPSGLHARPAAVFVKAAAGFSSDIRVANLTTDSAEVPAKSIIAVLGLGVQRGHKIRLRCQGVDEQAALSALRGLVESGLEESLDEAPPAASVT
ncbi:MAG TPA: HPr family phosphocarrier protein [Candidatus Deferrimicrobiaceae bacterium]|nr:HPr family phosphocarrier protein [Candidatus Deferrimicrobiaceae bacterium]